MSFGQSIRTVFKNLTNFKGRSRRSEFWWFYLFIFLVSIPLTFVAMIPIFGAVASAAANANPDGTLTNDQLSTLLATMGVTYALLLIFGLVTFFFMLAVWVRRLHDAGYSGHWLWFGLIGLGIIPLILAILDGQLGENRFGPNPAEAERSEWPAAPASGIYPPQPPSGHIGNPQQ